MSTKCIAILVAIVFFAFVGLWALQSYTPYQINCSPQSTLGFNVEGVLELETPIVAYPYNRTWDSFDLGIPLEKDRVFIATNIAIRDQQLGVCPEDHNVEGANCTTNSECSSKELRNGFPTGNCVTNDLISTCEIKAWCPATSPVFPLGESVPLFPKVKDFILKLQNEILFPDCEGLPSKVSLEGNDCDLHDNPSCPNIRIIDIIEGAGDDIALFLQYGGTYSLTIKWDCNFDDDVDECRPQYIFKHISDKSYISRKPVRHSTVNIHTADHRTLTDYIGAKISIKVEGTFSKTNYSAFVLTLIAAIILVIFLFGGILGISYFVFYAWIRGNQRQTQQVMESRSHEQQFQSVQCKN